MIDAQKLLGVGIHDRALGFSPTARRALKEVLAGDFAGSIEFLARTSRPPISANPGCSNPPPCGAWPAFARSPLIGPGVPDIRPSPTRAASFPTGSFGSRSGACSGLRTKSALETAENGAPSRGAALAQRHGRGLEAAFPGQPASTLDLGGHTHDGGAGPGRGVERQGRTLVTNAGSHGKFLAVLDLDVQKAGASPTTATGSCPFFATCCRRTAKWRD